MRGSRFRRVLTLLPVAAIGLTWAGVTGSPSAAAGSPLAQVAPVPAWVAQARPVGAAPGGQREAVTVYLRQAHAAAAAEFAAAVSDPRSPLYRHFLTPEQYRSRFAPDGAAVATVSGYLRAAGLRIDAVPANHLYVRASGTIIRLQRAFGTTVLRYRRGAGLAFAPAAPLWLPAGVAPLVAGVAGLDTSVASLARIGHVNLGSSRTGPLRTGPGAALPQPLQPPRSGGSGSAPVSPAWKRSPTRRPEVRTASSTRSYTCCTPHPCSTTSPA